MTHSNTSSKTNILLVDDDVFLLNIYGSKFLQHGYGVHMSNTTSEALDTVRSGFAPGVILFDVVMPEHDGFDLLQMLHDEKLAIEALKIALTNQTSDADRARAADLGVDLFLIKATLIPSEIVETVEKALRKR